MWLHANYMHPARIVSKNIAGEGKVCWLCRIREVIPTWRPGDSFAANDEEKLLVYFGLTEYELMKNKGLI